MAEYCDKLGIAEKDLEGKVIVDLGAGKTVRFAREVESKYPNSVVLSVSPDYGDPEYTKELPPERKVIISSGQKLPFDDESVDYVLSMWMVPHLVNKDMLFEHENHYATPAIAPCQRCASTGSNGSF